MISVENEIIERLQPLDKPKRLEVLVVVERMAQRRLVAATQSMLSSAEESNQSKENDQQLSFYELTKEFCGCIESGPSDLSTNPKYMEIFGK